MINRYEELDALRGIASSTVVIHHCLITFSVFLAAHYHQSVTSPIVKILANSPFHILWAGHEAVILFFILSGFVLTVLFANKQPKYSNYLVSRICRIYLPYMFSIIISTLLFILLKSSFNANLSSWYNEMWEHGLSFKEVISYIFMLGYDTHNINTVTWSLIHEMRISIFFPVIIFLINRYNWKKSLSIGSLTFVILWIILEFISMVFRNSDILQFLAHSYAMTFYYSVFFLIGALLAKYKENISALFKKVSKKGKYILFLCSLALYSLEWCVPFLGQSKYSDNIIKSVISATLIDYCIMLGAVMFLIFALNSQKLKILLQSKVLLNLGKVSYSLYLIHPIILLSSLSILRDVIPLYFIVIAVPIISLLVAFVMYIYVEKPSILFGRYLTKKSIQYNKSEIVLTD